jgi:hypothetical protein
LEERFQDVEQDGPNAYAAFLARSEDEEEKARLRREAVATVRGFLAGFGGTGSRRPNLDRFRRASKIAS